MNSSVNNWQDWIGKPHVSEQVITPWPMMAMAATLDRDDPPPAADAAVPPPWHWAYFLNTATTASLAHDGIVGRGGFLPPVDLPRRMWAGGRMEFAAPLRLGDRARRTSAVKSISEKHGRSGRLVFVVVRHEIHVGDQITVSEEHDIVYREAARPDAPPPPDRAPPATAIWSRQVEPSAALLFRYSALTFNGHRIHYDRDYCRDVEGYPGLLVHGPLSATLLLDLCRRHRPEATITGFDYRATKPLFDTAPFSVEGCEQPDGNVSLWIRDAAGATTMEATATLG